MPHHTQRRISIAGAACALAATAAAVSAHPHVWVSTKAVVIIENGAITALKHTWTFDEFYTAGAIEGLDTNKDGKVDRAELAELTKINMEGLKEFEYFTAAKAGGKPVEFADARDGIMEVVESTEAPGPANMVGAEPEPAKPAPGGITGKIGGLWSKLVGPGAKPETAKLLTIEFTLPLKTPMPAGKDAFSFTVNDPAMFIWLEQARKDAVKLSAGAPANCKAAVGAADLDDEQKRLNDAFGGVGGLNMGGGVKTVTVKCGAP